MLRRAPGARSLTWKGLPPPPLSGTRGKRSKLLATSDVGRGGRGRPGKGNHPTDGPACGATLRVVNIRGPPRKGRAPGNRPPECLYKKLAHAPRGTGVLPIFQRSQEIGKGLPLPGPQGVHSRLHMPDWYQYFKIPITPHPVDTNDGAAILTPQHDILPIT